jgi:hypothetical protein
MLSHAIPQNISSTNIHSFATSIPKLRTAVNPKSALEDKIIKKFDNQTSFQFISSLRLRISSLVLRISSLIGFIRPYPKNRWRYLWLSKNTEVYHEMPVLVHGMFFPVSGNGNIFVAFQDKLVAAGEINISTVYDIRVMAPTKQVRKHFFEPLQQMVRLQNFMTHKMYEGMFVVRLDIKNVHQVD